MNIVFVRHGEPDYDCLKSIDLHKISKNIAPLSINGEMQAEKASHCKALEDADIIISSPYTRALETSLFIGHFLNKKIIIEPDLREWECEIDYDPFNLELEKDIEKEFHMFKGVHSDKCKYYWESLEHLAFRANNVIKKYNQYKKVIIVTHAMLIRQFYYNPIISYCEPIEVEYTTNLKFTGYYEAKYE